MARHQSRGVSRRVHQELRANERHSQGATFSSSTREGDPSLCAGASAGGRDRRQDLKAKAKPRVGISMGDPSGIGPEIIAASLRSSKVKAVLRPIVFGDAGVFRSPVFAGVNADLRAITSLRPGDRRPGRPSLAGGKAQLAYIEAAVDA